MTSINLSDDLVKEARRYAAALSRSTPKQIEHWAKIGKLVEENPDLPYEFMQKILFGLQEMDDGDVEPYEFGTQGHPD